MCRALRNRRGRVDGLKRVKRSAAARLVQDPTAAQFDEMPRKLDCHRACRRDPRVATIPAKIATYKEIFGKVRSPLTHAQRPAELEHATARSLHAVRVRTGQHSRIQAAHDASAHRAPHDRARHAGPAGLRRFMREHHDETQALLKDLLISVTTSFATSKRSSS